MQAALFSGIVVLDDRIVAWLSQFVSRWPLFNLFVAWLIDARIVKFIPFVLVICWFWFEKTALQELRRRTLLEAVLTSLAAVFVARFLALTLPFRDRPVANPDLHLVIPFEAGLRTWSSFPSDHAIVAFALAASLARVSPLVGIWALLHALVFISFPRLYFGLHYPSDVIVGALIGITLAAATSQLRGRQVVTGALLKLESRYPAAFYAAAFFVLFEIAEIFDSVRIFVVNVFRVLRQLMT